MVHAAQDAAGTPAASPPGRPRPRRLPGGPTVAAKAAELQYDVEQIFRFVRDEVAYEAYAGALRGATGTLWGLAGNAVDQALLLAALLEQALVPIRFAVGELPADAGDRLLAAMDTDETAARDRAARALLASEPESDNPPVALSPEQEALARSLAERRQALLATAQSQTAEAVQTIGDALADGSVRLTSVTLTLPEQERAGHLWVQMADGPLWIDLDPTFADAQPGDAYAVAAATLLGVPEELYHTVGIRLVAERVTAGQPIRQDLLSFRARSADLVGVPITLRHAKPGALKALGLGIADALQGMVEYIPHLMIGLDQVVPGQRVSFTTGEGGLGAFGDVTGNEGDTLAEWMEFDIVAPDAPPRTVVREVFDRVGIERRGAGDVDVTTIPPAELTELGDPPAATYLPLEAVSSVAVATQPVPLAYYEQDYAVRDIFADWALVGHLYHTARDLVGLEIGAASGYRFYRNGPNLTAFTLTPRVIEADASQASAVVDLIHQAVAAVPLADASATVHPGVLAGVIGHVAERLIVESDPELLMPEPPARSLSGVGLVFEAARRANVPVRLLQPGAPLPPLEVSGRASARIDAALAAGYLVIVPERAVPVGAAELSGWWQVNPASGETFDLLETGQGAQDGEYVAVLDIEAEAAPAVRAVGRCTAWTIFIGALIVASVAVGVAAAGVSPPGSLGGFAGGVGVIAGIGGAYNIAGGGVLSC